MRFDGFAGSGVRTIPNQSPHREQFLEKSIASHVGKSGNSASVMIGVGAATRSQK